MCNTIWTDAIEAVRIGFECPVCRGKSTPEDVVATIFHRIGDGHYRLTEPFRGMGATQPVFHETCGQLTASRLELKIWHGTTCACEKVHNKQTLQERVNRVSSGFTVEDYDPNKGIVTLRHECGEQRRTFLNGFMTNPLCPHCKSKKRENQRRERLSDAIGADYEIIDCPSEGSVRVRHKLCGKEMTGNYEPFIYGRRCPLCTPYYRKDRSMQSLPYEADLLREMEAWFEHHALWVAGRHRKAEHTRQYYDALLKLVKRGYIYLVDRGLYSNRCEMDIYEVLKWKYLMDDQCNTVGNFTGLTAAFLAGKTDVEPETITLESSLLRRKDWSVVRAKGRKIKVRGI